MRGGEGGSPWLIPAPTSIIPVALWTKKGQDGERGRRQHSAYLLGTDNPVAGR